MERPGSLRLRPVTMNHGRREAIAGEVLGQPFRAPFGAGKNQAASRFLMEQMAQHFMLVVGRHLECVQFHVFNGLKS